MARTQLQSVDVMEDVSLPSDLDVKLNAMAQHRVEIMQQFGDGLPYERNRIVHETRFYMAQSAEAMLEAGKRLVILKENEPHGDFTEILETELGLAPQVARRMMQASVKFLGNSSETPKRSTLSVLGKGKLYELMTLDDDDLDALADGGTIAGATIDEIDRMSVRELRQSLRESRENAAAQQRILADKNEKIDELATKLEKKSRIQPPKPDEEVKKLRAEVTAISTEAESAVTVRLSSAFETLCDYCAENQIDTPRDFMAGLLCQLESTVRSLRATFDIPDEPTGGAAPDWLTASEPEV
ncbi:DUF3102 domain-containing protein [Citrobacter portucalensis]|uniref:DUF3102 domain-containing protein n=1 Tax=Citrobacter portucalensis TaxID=1639133 RepID=UPI00226B417B|nr:DUF3102 domain-containing protein [Citrobacter portucalensis]MCX9038968.1 DUF3102 domain-containing protein [Citrobacter portucalensis]